MKIKNKSKTKPEDVGHTQQFRQHQCVYVEEGIADAGLNQG